MTQTKKQQQKNKNRRRQEEKYMGSQVTTRSLQRVTEQVVYAWETETMGGIIN